MRDLDDALLAGVGGNLAIKSARIVHVHLNSRTVVGGSYCFGGVL
jgi:hypothetical protein